MHNQILFGTGFERGQNTIDVKKKELPKYIIETGEKRKLNTKVIRIKRQCNTKLNNQTMNDKME
jgi:hypothetical protein